MRRWGNGSVRRVTIECVGCDERPSADAKTYEGCLHLLRFKGCSIEPERCQRCADLAGKYTAKAPMPLFKIQRLADHVSVNISARAQIHRYEEPESKQFWLTVPRCRMLIKKMQKTIKSVPADRKTPTRGIEMRCPNI